MFPHGVVKVTEPLCVCVRPHTLQQHIRALCIVVIDGILNLCFNFYLSYYMAVRVLGNGI